MNQPAPEFAVSIEEVPPHEEAAPGIVADLSELTKVRLNLLVMITTFVGFCMASGAHIDWLRLVHTFFGTALTAAAAAALNQFWEANVDRLMARTRTRPLPSGRMRRTTALVLGLFLGLLGVAWLQWMVNTISAVLAGATVVVYVLIYTPMKRRTSLCTLVGAVSGAIPPMIGWTAARPSFDLGAWVLFGILFAWQMPHFLAIAWMHRDDYAQAGFVMLKRGDVDGSSTASQSLSYSLALLVISLIPFWSGMNSAIYLAGALLLNAAMTGYALAFLVDRSRSAARRLFFASIIYLPLILGLMIFTKA